MLFHLANVAQCGLKWFKVVSRCGLMWFQAVLNHLMWFEFVFSGWMWSNVAYCCLKWFKVVLTWLLPLFLATILTTITMREEMQGMQRITMGAVMPVRPYSPALGDFNWWWLSGAVISLVDAEGIGDKCLWFGFLGRAIVFSLMDAEGIGDAARLSVVRFPGPRHCVFSELCGHRGPPWS